MENSIIVINAFILMSNILYTLLMFRRNTRVCVFRNYVINSIKNGNWELLKAYRDGPTYRQMLYSFKSLTLQNWYDEDFINCITENYGL